MRFSTGLLRRLRESAESLMTDECEIRRPGEMPATDPDTGIPKENTGAPVYRGKCKLQSDGGVGAEDTSTGGLAASWLQRLDLPYGTIGVETGDIATITDARNPSTRGIRLRLISPQSHKTHATAERWNVKEVNSDALQDV